MNKDKISRLRDLSHGELSYDTGKFLDEYADLLDAIDKAEPVGEIIMYPHANFTILTVSAELPAGTKLYANPPKQEQSPIDERAEFEKWASEMKFTLLRDRKSGEYVFAHSELSWDVWQARAKLLAPVVPDEKPLDKIPSYAEVVQALEDLSFECFNLFNTVAPSIATYNKTFEILEAARAFKAKAAMLKGEK